MKKLEFLLFFIAILIISCNNDDSNTSNPLIETGLIGDWEISGRGINNISSLEALCCETLSFSDDDNEEDLNGSYVFDEYGTITNGTYTVSSENSTITYTTESNITNIIEFTVNNDVLEIWYFDENGRNWTTYNKQ
ncbi:hypothetical protein ACPX19_12085 [Winogradskyella sp. HB-48]|uniref:hypothetical protein n=1 Tax=Winogradskyella sp. HB-48 TaxID=3416808 RepID=UPI003CF55122